MDVTIARFALLKIGFLQRGSKANWSSGPVSWTVYIARNTLLASWAATVTHQSSSPAMPTMIHHVREFRPTVKLSSWMSTRSDRRPLCYHVQGSTLFEAAL